MYIDQNTRIDPSNSYINLQMAPRLLKHVAAGIDAVLRSDPTFDPHILASTFNTTYKSISERGKRIRRETSGVLIPPRKPGCRPWCTPQVIDLITKDYIADPELYLNEISDYIYMEFDLKLSVPMVSKLLKKMKYTYKVTQAIAQEQHPELVVDWR